MNDIPVVSDEIMDEIFAHGGQRAKSHDQRFGQWLVNKIRTNSDSEDIVRILFNIENPEMLEMLRDYND